MGQPVLTRARAAQEYLHGATPLSADQRARLDTQLMTVLQAQHRIEHHSRRLTQGMSLPHGNIVNASDPTLAPMCKGKRHGPAQCGRKPGIIAEPAAGFIFGLHRPVGNPRDASSVQPLIDHVQRAMARVAMAPRPTIHSLAGDLAFNDASLREAWHQQGILTVGLPHTVEPLPPSPPSEDVLRLLSEEDWPRARTPCQVHLAYACGYSRPVIESIIASLLCRGAAHLTYKGQRGAIVHLGMAVMAHHAATLVRIHEYRLSKRARAFRRRLRVRCRKVSQFNASIN